VSGAIHEPTVHFEAPPSPAVPTAMAAFIDWFNAAAPTGKRPLRALAEKALAQGAGQPSLTALSLLIQQRHKAYYSQLEAANKGLKVDDWLDWFSALVRAAQAHTLSWLEFLMEKTRLRGKLNTRQEKTLLRLFREGPEGFHGGLSASNYVALTGTSAATAGRDLLQLVALGALRPTDRLIGQYSLIW